MIIYRGLLCPKCHDGRDLVFSKDGSVECYSCDWSGHEDHLDEDLDDE